MARSSNDPARITLDGPFAETKELLLGYGGITQSKGRYAFVNGLPMYYELHGRGRPLVLLHSALSTIDGAFGGVIRALASSRMVIAVEQQAHGRTPDIARELSYGQMADDTAELLRQLELERVDVFGYSMGGMVALELAVRHPQRVRRLAVVSGGFNVDGYRENALEMLRNLDPNDRSWSEGLRKEFERVGAAPEQWPKTALRIKTMMLSYSGIARSDLHSIRAPTLFIGGEVGLIRQQHVVEMSRIVPRAQLKVFPWDDHHPSMVRRSATLVPGFLDAPL